MASKFDLIVETAMKRYQGANFLIGDRVKPIENWASHEWFKTQPAVKLERMKAMFESGDNIRVTAVKASRPVTAQTGHFQDVDGYFVDIVREAAPGLWMSNEVYTLPDFLVELMEDYPNHTPIPDKQRKEDPSNIKPEAVEEEQEGLMKDQTRCEHPDKVNPTDNTNIETAPAAKSYTGKYIES